jgi:anti-sigma B factor antagonist
MTIRVERAGAAVVVNLEGPLTIEADTRRLRALVGSLTRDSPRHVILDLRKVERLDCSGIGQLVQLHNRVRGAGGVLTLVNVDDRQRRLLQMVGLLNVFRICPSSQEAIEAGRIAPAPDAAERRRAVAVC